jgi:hypothetical protein
MKAINQAPVRNVPSTIMLVLLLGPLIGGCSREATPADDGAIVVVRGQGAVRPVLSVRHADSVTGDALVPEIGAANVARVDDGAPPEGWQADAQDEVASAWKRSSDPYRLQDAISLPMDQADAS